MNKLEEVGRCSIRSKEKGLGEIFVIKIECCKYDDSIYANHEQNNLLDTKRWVINIYFNFITAKLENLQCKSLERLWIKKIGRDFIPVCLDNFFIEKTKHPLIWVLRGNLV